MITNLGLATVWVLDQDAAKKFFTEKVGLEVRDDMTLGDGGMRWITVGAKDQPDLSLALMIPGPPTMDPDSAEQMRALIAKGVLGAGAFTTDDCQGDYERMSADGVEFVHPPQKRPYGLEAVFRDDSGCWYSLTQPLDKLDESQPWGDCVS